jgi:undecaprenyl diphosphate synthase
MRVSNFLIWQGAYAEYYVTPVLWPDFDKDEFYKALTTFGQRDRRYGGIHASEY